MLPLRQFDELLEAMCDSESEELCTAIHRAGSASGTWLHMLQSTRAFDLEQRCRPNNKNKNTF